MIMKIQTTIRWVMHFASVRDVGNIRPYDMPLSNHWTA
jgi:hypothetical protein